MRFSKRKKSWYLVIIAIFFIGLFFLVQSPWRLFFSYFTAPVYKISSNLLSYFTPEEKLIAENEKLQNDIKSLIVDYALLKKLEQENEELKNLFNYKSSPEYKKVVAEIVSSIPSLEKNIFLLNKGENFGLKPDQPVISSSGLMIGKILQVDKFTSQMVLLESSLFKTTAYIQNDLNSIGLVEGTRNLGIRMNYIAQEDELNIGDLVVTSGRDSFIPRGLILGKITAIHKNEGDFFQSASITSPEQIQNIFFVNVLIPVYD
jgi:rod shape-determining protein MreC